MHWQHRGFFWLTAVQTSGGIPPRDTAMKPCVKTLEVQRLREKSAPMPIIFGLLFEVHSDPADGVSSSQRGGGTLGCCPWEPLAFKLLTSCCIYVPFILWVFFFFFIRERLTCKDKRRAGEQTCGRAEISLTVWRFGSQCGSFSQHRGCQKKMFQHFLEPKNGVK